MVKIQDVKTHDPIQSFSFFVIYWITLFTFDMFCLSATLIFILIAL
jgi:hypothetical protein